MKVTVIVLSLVLSILAITQDVYAWSGDTWGDITRAQITAIAHTMIDPYWKPAHTIYNNTYVSVGRITYYASSSYHGEAYTQGTVDNWSEFSSHVKNTSGGNTTYGNDCSAFASICWKLTARQTTRSFESGLGTKWSSLGGVGTCDTVTMYQGDACNDSGSHIVLFNKRISGGIETMEQTGAGYRARMYTRTYSALNSYRPIRRKQIVTSTVVAPATPTGLVVDCQESGYGVVFKWSAVSGATAYDLAWMKEGGAWTYSPADVTKSNAANVSWPGYYFVFGSGRYRLAVRAQNTGGSSGWAYSPSATTFFTVPDQKAPAVPGGLTAKALSSTSVSLTWTASTGANGYTVYCSNDKNIISDRCYKKTAAASGTPAWTGLAYVTDGIKTNDTYAGAQASANTSMYVSFGSDIPIHKFNYRFYDGDNRIYKNAFPFWGSAAGTFYPLGKTSTGSANYRSYRTEGAVRLAAAADANCNRVGVGFSGDGNTVNDYNHVTEYEAHGGYFAKTTATSYTANNLKPGTSYYFRIDAYQTTTAVLGISELLSYSGSIVTVFTPNAADTVAPSAVADLKAVSGATSGSVGLTWTGKGDNGTTGNITGGKYRIDYSAATKTWAVGTYQKEWSTSVVVGAAQSYTVTNLLAGTTYYFCVWTADDSGNWSANSNIANAPAKIAADKTAPSAVNTLNVIPGSSPGTVTISWNCTGDDGTAGNINGKYRIDYATTQKTWAVGTFKQENTLTASPGQTITKTVAGLTPGSTYFFCAWICDDSGNWSANSNIDSTFAKPGTISDATPPTNPVLCTAYDNSGKENSAVNASWTNISTIPYFEWTGADDNESGVTGYSVYWGTSISGDPGTTETVVDNGMGTYTAPSAVASGSTYYLRVKTKNSAGLWSAAATIFEYKYDNTVPVNPTTCNAWADDTKAKAVPDDQWQNIDAGPYIEFSGATDSGSGVAGYSVYWGSNSAVIPDTVVNKSHAATVTYFTTAATSEQPYYLILRTKDAAGNWSDAVTLFTLKYDKTAPGTPVLESPDLEEVTKNTLPVFSWFPIEYNTAVKYTLQVAANANFSPALIDVTITTVTYTPTTAFAQGGYYWRVRASDDFNNVSGWSVTRDFSIDTNPPAGVTSLTASNIGGGDIQLEWTAVYDAFGVDYYNIYRQAGLSGTKEKVSVDGSVKDSLYINAGTELTAGVQYYYTVQAVDIVGNECTSGNVPVSITCDKTGISAIITATPSSISPNGDGVDDETVITYKIGSDAVIKIVVMNEDVIIRTLVDSANKTSGQYTVNWDGKNNDGSVEDAGLDYIIVLTATANGATSTRKTVVRLDSNLPEIVDVSAVPSAISPNNDGFRENTIIKYTLTETSKVTITAKSQDNTSYALLTNSAKSAGTYTFMWEGRNPAGAVLPDGVYEIQIVAVDNAGNSSDPVTVNVSIELETGAILGQVYDSRGANELSNRLGGALVSLDNGSSATSGTNGAQLGFFEFTGLVKGAYEVTITKRGYEAVKKTVEVVQGKAVWASTSLKYVGTSDNTAPVIEHVPLTKICIQGNKVLMVAQVTDDNSGVKEAKVKYRLLDDTNQEIEKGEKVMSFMGDIFIGTIQPEDLPSAVSAIEYSLTAEDIDGNIAQVPDTESAYTVIYVKDAQQYLGINGGRLALTDANPEDGEVAVKLPIGSVDSNVLVQAKQKDTSFLENINNPSVDSSVTKPVAAYEFKSEGFILSTPAQVDLLFFDFDNDGLVDGTDYNERDLKVFYYDGQQWRFIGGSVDTTRNVITIETNVLGVFGVFPMKSLDMLKDGSFYAPKEKVFTPNRDGKNDFVLFNGISNVKYVLSLSESIKVNIFNISNKLVRELVDTDVWDGRDSNGELVENGIYIYQYIIDGKATTGSIVVAK